MERDDNIRRVAFKRSVREKAKALKEERAALKKLPKADADAIRSQKYSYTMEMWDPTSTGPDFTKLSVTLNWPEECVSL